MKKQPHWGWIILGVISFLFGAFLYGYGLYTHMYWTGPFKMVSVEFAVMGLGAFFIILGICLCALAFD